jgi:aryl-alcohol dehydrogenase-like predicted oxidoreductase
MEAMNAVLDSGKARAIAVSNFSVEQMQECLKHGSIASNQPLYNMLDREIEDEILPFCDRKNIGVIVYSPLHQGLLTGKVDMDREFDEGDWRAEKWWFQPEQRREVLNFLDKVRPIAETHGKTLAQLAINWCLCQQGVTSAIVGARNPAQVRENAEGADWQLTDEELNLIRQWIGELKEAVGEKEK